MVKDHEKNARILAIGDGANDVNMITEAHVGVGIKGVEGRQASRASDYAIGEFKSLRRLMFLYGRESYRKNSILVLYSFYKNILLAMPQFWYAALFVNWSGIHLYDPYIFQFVNLFFTSLPIVLYALFDRDGSYEQIECSHQYYKAGIHRLYFNSVVFWQWFSYACVQSLIIVLLW